jgi:hypothetical protein
MNLIALGFMRTCDVVQLLMNKVLTSFTLAKPKYHKVLSFSYLLDQVPKDKPHRERCRNQPHGGTPIGSNIGRLIKRKKQSSNSKLFWHTNQ